VKKTKKNPPKKIPIAYPLSQSILMSTHQFFGTTTTSNPKPISAYSHMPVSCKFKVGDSIIAIKGSPYLITTDGWTGKVVDVFLTPDLDGADMKVLGFKGKFNVESRFFELLKPEKKTKESSRVSIGSVVIDRKKIEEIRAAISQVKNTEKIFSEWGFDEVFEKGTAISMLFWGIPGTGKTLMAQAIADEIGAELKIIGTADIQTSEPGGAERAIKKYFAEANKANTQGDRKMILLFDECDTLLMDRNKIGVILAAEVNTLLSEIERYTGIVIFTTNRLGQLDPALERRITAKVEFEFPEKDAREKIWKRMIPKKAPLDEDVDFKALSEFPLVGGNIKNAVLNAARKAAYEGLKKINRQCFIDAIEKEVRAIQAFISEYEKQDKTTLAGQMTREPSGVVVDRSSIKKLPVSTLFK